MISTYGDDATRDVHYGDNTKHARPVPQELWAVARRKLNLIDHAHGLQDLKSPGNNLEKLKGDRAGTYSIRINKQYRITFKWWDNGETKDVTIEKHYEP